jgi:excinuclease ABC subunit A
MPLARLTVVTGVSGSGKSTLARDVLHDNLRARGEAGPPPRQAAKRSTSPCTAAGDARLDRRPRAGGRPDADRQDAALLPGDLRRLLGRRSASSSPTPPTRACAAGTPRASPSTPAPGRCPACEGQGCRPDRDELPARREGALRGLRRRALQPRDAVGALEGQDIGRGAGDERWTRRWTSSPRIPRSPTPLRLLQDVGLGYLTLGQQSPTLSGGEAQRIKLVTELAKVRAARAMPTPARAAARRQAHPLRARRAHRRPAHGRRGEADPRAAPPGRRRQHGVVIEHNLDVMAEADWIIDLGPGRRRRRRSESGSTRCSRRTTCCGRWSPA